MGALAAGQVGGQKLHGLDFLARCFENVVHMRLLSSWLIPNVSRASVDITFFSGAGLSEPGWRMCEEKALVLAQSCHRTAEERTFNLTHLVILFAPLMDEMPRGT